MRLPASRPRKDREEASNKACRCQPTVTKRTNIHKVVGPDVRMAMHALELTSTHKSTCTYKHVQMRIYLHMHMHMHTTPSIASQPLLPLPCESSIVILTMVPLPSATPLFSYSTLLLHSSSHTPASSTPFCSYPSLLPIPPFSSYPPSFHTPLS